MTHDELCREATRARNLVSRESVTVAFVASLGTRNRAARSALGSLAILQHFPVHAFDASQEFVGRCRVCGLEAEIRPPSSAADLAACRQRYPFQVRHTDIWYSAHDLAAFAFEAPLSPAPKDWDLFHGILAAIRALPPTAGLTDLNRCLVGRFPSNKLERQILLEQLGYCGILCPTDQESYRNHFVAFEIRERRQPAHFYRREWEYPVRYWTGTDGINDAALALWFSPWLPAVSGV